MLDYFAPYLSDGGRERMTRAVKDQVEVANEDLIGAKHRATEELENLGVIINNLLDNITATNRAYVDQRLKELNLRKQQLESRLDELDHLEMSQAQITSIANDAMQFLSSLEFTLTQGLPQEKLVALRQCIERVHVDRPNARINVDIKRVPAGSLHATEAIEVTLPIPNLDAEAAQEVTA